MSPSPAEKCEGHGVDLVGQVGQVGQVGKKDSNRRRWRGFTPPSDPGSGSGGLLGLRCRRDTPQVVPDTLPPCTSCSAPVAAPEDVLCPACLEARRKVVPFDPDRRRRTEAALAGGACPACGWSWWQVDHRGDSHCVACSELLAGRVPRCGTCQRTDGWETVDGRKRCAHAPVAVLPTRPADGEPCPACQSTRWTPHPPAVPGGAPLYLCSGGHWWTAARLAPSSDPSPAAAVVPGNPLAARAAKMFAPQEARP